MQHLLQGPEFLYTRESLGQTFAVKRLSLSRANGRDSWGTPEKTWGWVLGNVSPDYMIAMVIDAWQGWTLVLR